MLTFCKSNHAFQSEGVASPVRSDMFIGSLFEAHLSSVGAACFVLSTPPYFRAAPTELGDSTAQRHFYKHVAPNGAFPPANSGNYWRHNGVWNVDVQERSLHA